MEELWRANAKLLSSDVDSCAAAIEYLRPPQVESAPSRKRRKIEESKYDFRIEDSDAVLLASRVLECSFPVSRTASAKPEHVEVSVDSSTRISEGVTNVTISAAGGDTRSTPCKPLQIQLLHASSEILSHLADICPLPAAPLSNKNAVAWSRCVLKTGGQIDTLFLETSIFLAPDRSWQDSRSAASVDKLLQRYMPADVEVPMLRWSPQDFYENVHVPPQDEAIHFDHPQLTCKLYPFQQRALQWMMHREGALIENKQIISSPSIQLTQKDELPPSFRRTIDARGDECYISEAHRIIVKNEWSLLDFQPELKGGILAEEMGLGKTVELIALISLHKQSPHLHGHKLGGLLQSQATLIITPAHILPQWLSEIETHAPHLKVLHYRGLKGQHAENGPEAVNHSKNPGDYAVMDVMQYDIVLVTYKTLAREIHFAETPPDRSRRYAPTYRRKLSPLVTTKWWRVCLDEAQMVESGVSQASKLARLIPRTNAWAVSGTPLKKNVDDLHGLLIFLGYEPFASSRKSWQRVDKLTLKQIVGSISIRHNKHKVAHELRLPTQRRAVISMPFSAIEGHHYDEMYKAMCNAIGVNADGSPTQGKWNPEDYADHMRSWLKRLRETCLHPHVGAHNRRALGRGQGPLRTVAEVLETMIEQNLGELRAQERLSVLSQVLRGQIINNDKSNESRSQDALQIYMEALAKAELLVQDCRAACEADHAGEGKAKNANASSSLIESDGEDSDDYAADRSRQKKRTTTPRRQLRSALEALHVCVFFIATAYYQQKEQQRIGHPLRETTTSADSVPDKAYTSIEGGNHSFLANEPQIPRKEALDIEQNQEFYRLEALEAQWYDRAKAIRNELLHSVRNRASREIAKVRNIESPESSMSLIDTIPILDASGGIENQKILRKLDETSAVLDAQAGLINDWRAKIIKILTGPLVDVEDENEITGEEYEDSTKLQDELYAYVTVLNAVISDRQQCISGEKNFLMEVDLKQAVKQAKAGQGHAPELLLKALEERKKVCMKDSQIALQAIISEARSLASSLSMAGASSRAKIEADILEVQLGDIRRITNQQRDIIKTLEKEQLLFHNCMNERVEFYRQLQELSDMVAPWREDIDEALDRNALGAQLALEETHANRVATLKTKQRFLLHLKAESAQQTEARICVICTDPFENGVLTVCGHLFCKECITLWLKSHRTCPECRRVLNMNDFHDITYKPKQLKIEEEKRHDGEESSTTSSPSRDLTGSGEQSVSSPIYSNMSLNTMNEIKSIDLEGKSFGTKIDLICRHLIWLRENDTGAKSIIFSQYNDFLGVLSTALKHFKISAVSIRDPKGIEKFRRDPSKECFLLDAKSDSSGLNLVNATHVFLCEPLVNAAIELQAIARVHRIGQMRETNVYMYLVSDTVEEAIYELSVNRRLAHISKSRDFHSEATSRDLLPTQTPAALQEHALDMANNMEMQQAPVSTLLAKGKDEGELVAHGDLWQCLFGKPFNNGTTVSEALQVETGRQRGLEAAEARRARATV